jgi:hypothetical protein
LEVAPETLFGFSTKDFSTKGICHPREGADGKPNILENEKSVRLLTTPPNPLSITLDY